MDELAYVVVERFPTHVHHAFGTEGWLLEGIHKHISGL